MYLSTIPRGRLALGDVRTAQYVSTGVRAGLTTAAVFDPEPFSKAALLIAAGITDVFVGMFRGCGETCTAATAVVNKVEPYLRQNRDNYLSQPVRTRSMQQQALAVFDDAWAQVVAGCSDPRLGDAGARCISERQRGGSAPWCPTSTGCDWFLLYRDPIQNDPDVQADSFLEAPGGGLFDLVGAGGTAGGSIGALPAGLLIAALLVAVAAVA